MGASREADVIVLGVGTCGEDLSLRLLDAGLDVVGIEASLVGGECAYWACLPSKMMIRAGNLLQEGGRIEGVAGHAAIHPDWTPVAARVRTEATGGWDDTVASERFRSHGGTLVHGRGTLAGPNTVAVGDDVYSARRGVVIATGSQPAVPPIPGLADADYWTTHDMIQAETLPRSLLVLGGGAVGCELGQVYARFGVDVTIVEGQDRLLPGEEPEASAVLGSVMASSGIPVETGSAVERVESHSGAIGITLGDGRELFADKLLVATGRRVDVSGLGLEAVGLDPAARFIAVDDRMRASEGLWAMGDVTGKAMFTHVALYQSGIVAADLLGENVEPARYHAVPRVTFTDPEVASVGMTEAEARAGGTEIVVAVKELPSTFRGWLHGAGNEGLIKLIVDSQSGLLVGATAVGPRAGEVLGLLSLAVHAAVPLRELQSMIYPFPTFNGAIGEAVGAYARGLAAVFDPGYRALGALDSVGGDGR